MRMLYVAEFVHGKYGNDVPINIIYEDRPTTDFNSLFLVLSGLYMHIEVSNSSYPPNHGILYNEAFLNKYTYLVNNGLTMRMNKQPWMTFFQENLWNCSQAIQQCIKMYLFLQVGVISSINVCQTTLCISPTRQQLCTTWAKGYPISNNDWYTYINVHPYNIVLYPCALSGYNTGYSNTPNRKSRSRMLHVFDRREVQVIQNENVFGVRNSSYIAILHFRMVEMYCIFTLTGRAVFK